MSSDVIQQSVTCNRCGGGAVAKDGKTSAGNQRYRCKSCGKIIVLDPGGRINPVAKDLADGLLRQGVAVPILAKAFTKYASRRWLYRRRNELNG